MVQSKLLDILPDLLNGLAGMLPFAASLIVTCQATQDPDLWDLLKYCMHLQFDMLGTFGDLWSRPFVLVSYQSGAKFHGGV